jgi:glycosidase
VIFQMTYVGAPMVYYGDEVGMWGANDPDDRKPMLWGDLTYDPEVYLPDGSRQLTPDRVVVDEDLLHHYQTLIQIRNQYPALQVGDYQTLVMDDARDLYVFARSDGDQRAFAEGGSKTIVVLNGSARPQTLEIPLEMLGDQSQQWVDVFNAQQPKVTATGNLILQVEGQWGSILVAS